MGVGPLERIATHNSAVVADLWGRQGGGGGGWEVHFGRSFQDWCSLCKENEESTDHILIHCGKTKELWTLLLSSFLVVWCSRLSVRNLLLEWKV
ncbi:hypothetical protein CK203_073147 [Vitis vinifera]|uniref:Reverse transcriptase zinc-binding domain-containing protein n=1 Tax=Vitis vinifera TaxID=29760 RepID=A0A438BXS0_VITVI|nr:hypothetical protein CK203_073147 [Vitis vinifera]